MLLCNFFFHVTRITVVALISGVSRSDGLGQYFAEEKKVIESMLLLLLQIILDTHVGQVGVEKVLFLWQVSS